MSPGADIRPFDIPAPDGGLSEKQARQRVFHQRREALALFLRGMGQRAVEPGVDAQDELPGIGLLRILAPPGAELEVVTLRLRIRTLMVVIAVVAAFVGIFAPELRAWNRNTLLIFSAMSLVMAIALASLTPVWIMLFWLRRRERQGSAIRAVDYAGIVLAFLSSLGILVAIGLAVRWMVVR